MEQTHESVHRTQPHECLPFSEVHAPGCYVENDTGDLLRVPEDALMTGKSPRIDIVSKQPRLVTKIADDPWVRISTARQLAADADLYSSF